MNRRSPPKPPPRHSAGRDRKAPLGVAGAVAGLLLLTAGLVALVDDLGSRGDGIGGPWRLAGAGGRTVTDRDFRGRYLLLYFGYTSCPDVCPATLAAIADAMQRLGDRGAALQPVFITVDPAHDTPDAVARYVRAFSPRLIGLSGTPDEVRTAEREYHISVAAHPSEASPTGYTVDHTSVLLLVGPDGRTLAPLPADDGGDRLAARLAHYL